MEAPGGILGRIGNRKNQWSPTGLGDGRTGARASARSGRDALGLEPGASDRPKHSYGGHDSVDEDMDNAFDAQAMVCKCRNSHCLKLYCVCFAAQRFCDGCACVECGNTEDNVVEVEKRRCKVNAKNPHAFQDKKNPTVAKGCNCLKSRCLKGYCECFAAGRPCLAICCCKDCDNIYGPRVDTGEPQRKDRPAITLTKYGARSSAPAVSSRHGRPRRSRNGEDVGPSNSSASGAHPKRQDLLDLVAAAEAIEAGDGTAATSSRRSPRKLLSPAWEDLLPTAHALGCRSGGGAAWAPSQPPPWHTVHNFGPETLAPRRTYSQDASAASRERSAVLFTADAALPHQELLQRQARALADGRWSMPASNGALQPLNPPTASQRSRHALLPAEGVEEPAAGSTVPCFLLPPGRLLDKHAQYIVVPCTVAATGIRNGAVSQRTVAVVDSSTALPAAQPNGVLHDAQGVHATWHGTAEGGCGNDGETCQQRERPSTSGDPATDAVDAQAMNAENLQPLTGTQHAWMLTQRSCGGPAQSSETIFTPVPVATSEMSPNVAPGSFLLIPSSHVSTLGLPTLGDSAQHMRAASVPLEETAQVIDATARHGQPTADSGDTIHRRAEYHSSEYNSVSSASRPRGSLVQQEQSSGGCKRDAPACGSEAAQGSGGAAGDAAGASQKRARSEPDGELGSFTDRPVVVPRRPRSAVSQAQLDLLSAARQSRGPEDDACTAEPLQAAKDADVDMDGGAVEGLLSLAATGT